MQEDETFDEFFVKLSSIRNSTINLGKKVLYAKMVRSKWFRPKVIAIKESKDLEFMRVEELVGSFQTNEHTLPQSKKNKSIAFKIVKKSGQ